MFYKINKKLLRLVLCLCITSVSSLMFAQGINKITVGNFSAGDLKEWKPKAFKGETDYHLSKLDGIQVLKAGSNAAASGLFYEQKIDLQKTPIMNWRWRIENRLNKPNEQAKSGDDFAARVYVVVSGGIVFWDTKAINYVWASTSPKYKIWPNAFAGNHAIMLAVRSFTDETGTWYTEKRDVLGDFKQLMGEDIRYIDAVAIMTDTDNAGGKVTAYYGDIYFTAE